MVAIFLFCLFVFVIVYVPLELQIYGEINYADADVVFANSAKTLVPYNPVYSDGS